MQRRAPSLRGYMWAAVPKASSSTAIAFGSRCAVDQRVRGADPACGRVWDHETFRGGHRVLDAARYYVHVETREVGPRRCESPGRHAACGRCAGRLTAYK